jgi:hypothetical protein
MQRRAGFAIWLGLSLATTPVYTMHFVGCRPNATECKFSCPELGAFKVTVDKEKCDPNDYWERFACYCLDSALEEVDPALPSEGLEAPP